MKQATPLVIIAGLLGCSSGDTSYLPLSVGKEWGYEVKAGFQRSVATVKVTSRVAVGEVSGYRLMGSFGESRLAWKETKLICTEMANCRFTAPIPLLDTEKIPTDPKNEEFKLAQKWSAKVDSFGTQRQATATLKQRTTKLPGQSTKLVQTRLEILIGNSTMEIISWFEKGKGIVRQEQRTNGNLIVAAELLKY